MPTPAYSEMRRCCSAAAAGAAVPFPAARLSAEPSALLCLFRASAASAAAPFPAALLVLDSAKPPSCRPAWSGGCSSAERMATANSAPPALTQPKGPA